MIERPQARLQLPGEAVVQTPELRLARLRQIEVGEQLPQRDREVPHQGILDLGEPAHEAGQRRAGDAVGQQEVEIFLLGERGDEGFDCHESVSSQV
ncbi:hypothetical protein ABH994_001787 [Bradyrhizobium yuanmingense]